MLGLGIPMTVEEFHLMPWRLGWKHEYYDGMAQLTPAGVSVECVLALAPRAGVADNYLVPVDPSWSDALMHGFAEAFQGSGVSSQ